jgi:hypothetical protein
MPLSRFVQSVKLADRIPPTVATICYNRSMNTKTQYAVSLIGTGYRLVEPEVAFAKKQDALAYAKAGLTRLGVFDARVQRQLWVEYEVCLFETDAPAAWVDDRQVARFRRNPTAAEMDEARRDARERAAR